MNAKSVEASRIDRFYETLVEAVDDVIFVVGSDGRYQMFNERGLKPFGYSSKDVIGKRPIEVFPEEIARRFEENNRTVFEEGKPRLLEEWLTLGGRSRCYSTVLSPIFDDSGQVSAVVGIGRDVTELKRLSEELETYVEEMESIVERRVRYERFIADLTHEAIKRQSLAHFLSATVTKLGEMMRVSRAYLFEYDARKQAVTNTHEWVAPGIASVRHEYQDASIEAVPWVADELLAGRTVCLENIASAPSLELRERLAQQQVKSLLVVPIFTFGVAFGCIGFDECLLHRHWEATEVALLQAVGRIIATTIERRRLEAEVLRSERLAATGRLAASIAHEINNPLQGITLHLDAIRDHIDKKRQRNFDFVVEGFQRITRIIRRLLDLHRDAKKAGMVEINAAVEEAFRLVANQSSAKGCDVRWCLAPKLPAVPGSADQLHHVFLNLLLNAVDSMEGQGTLTVSTLQEKGMVVVEIEDTGVGIDEESLPYLFEPFFSTKERAGTGLGLFVAHAIVVDHGGCIEVKSTKGKGTVMRVLLPIEAAKETKLTP